eukprot:3248907-Rhodomonas_salina.1
MSRSTSISSLSSSKSSSPISVLNCAMSERTSRGAGRQIAAVPPIPSLVLHTSRPRPVASTRHCALPGLFPPSLPRTSNVSSSSPTPPPRPTLPPQFPLS